MKFLEFRVQECQDSCVNGLNGFILATCGHNKPRWTGWIFCLWNSKLGTLSIGRKISFWPKSTVVCYFHILKISIKGLFVDPPKLANLQSLQLTWSQHPAQVLNTITTKHVSSLYRYVIVQNNWRIHPDLTLEHQAIPLVCFDFRTSASLETAPIPSEIVRQVSL